VVHTFHGHVLSGYFSPAMNWVVRATERALARVTDCVVTISPAQQLEIVNRFGIAPLARTAVVPLGLELDALLALAPGAADLRAALDIPPDAVVAGYVGRFVAIKNLELLLSAFADALARVPRLVLLLAGDGPARAALEAQARALGILPAVRFAGWLEDLPALYATIDIGVISSRNEGTPVAIIEAMAAGKPVVATAVGGVPDVVEHERTGLLVAPDDRQALAATLARLAADAGLRAALGRAGRAQAVRFSSVRLIDDLDRLYRQMLAAKRTASSPAS
jgi:glycosyltransferase involved in cell wall biosynthesis